MIRGCDDCGMPLEAVLHEEDVVVDTLQYKDALIIDISGGYGMFVDTLWVRPEKIVLCGKCAAQLVRIFPSFARCIEGVNKQVAVDVEWEKQMREGGI